MTPAFAWNLRRDAVRRQDPTLYYDENPLRVIGLGPEILDLGVPDDELHPFVKKHAQRLLALFHPDREGPTARVKNAQRRYATAHEYLKDRARFAYALDELRQARSERRSESSAELRLYREKASMLELLNQNLERQLTQAAGDLENFRREIALLRSSARERRFP